MQLHTQINAKAIRACRYFLLGLDFSHSERKICDFCARKIKTFLLPRCLVFHPHIPHQSLPLQEKQPLGCGCHTCPPHLPHPSFWYSEFKLSLPHLHKDVGAHQANETAHLSTAGALDFNLVLCEVPGAISKAHQSRVFRKTACARCGCGFACTELESWRGGLGLELLKHANLFLRLGMEGTTAVPVIFPVMG